MASKTQAAKCRLLSLSVFALLSASTVTAETYYCDSPHRLDIQAGPQPTTLLVCRNQSESAYRPGSRCSFSVRAPPGSLLFVELLNSGRGLGRGANFTLANGYKKLLDLTVTGDNHRLPGYSTTLVTPAGQLSVSMAASSTGPAGTGLTVRVRSFQRCPPGWVELSYACYGTADVDQLEPLSFADAQLACNSMRSNLMTLAYGVQAGGGVDDARDRLSAWGLEQGATGAWIGVTDATAWGRLVYYWLDGGQFGEHSRIGCNSGSFNYRQCLPSEHCAQLSFSARPVLMTSCSTAMLYLCNMPIGSTDRFHLVPAGALTNATNFNAEAAAGTVWVWIVVLAAFLVTCLLTVGIWLAVRYWSSVKPPRVRRLRSTPTLPPPYTPHPVASFNPHQLEQLPPPPYSPSDLPAYTETSAI